MSAHACGSRPFVGSSSKSSCAAGEQKLRQRELLLLAAGEVVGVQVLAAVEAESGRASPARRRVRSRNGRAIRPAPRHACRTRAAPWGPAARALASARERVADVPALGLLHARHEFEQGGLPAAVAAHHSMHAAAAHREVEPAQHPRLAAPVVGSCAPRTVRQHSLAASASRGPASAGAAARTRRRGARGRAARPARGGRWRSRPRPRARCVDMITVTPRSRFTAGQQREELAPWAFGSSWAVGSSSRSSRGRSARAAARFTICFCPPDSVSHAACSHGSMPKKCAASATRRRIASCGVPRFSNPNASSCSTVSHTSCASGSCMTKPICAALMRGRGGGCGGGCGAARGGGRASLGNRRVEQHLAARLDAARARAHRGQFGFERTQKRGLAAARRPRDHAERALLDRKRPRRAAPAAASRRFLVGEREALHAHEGGFGCHARRLRPRRLRGRFRPSRHICHSHRSLAQRMIGTASRSAYAP